MEQKELLAELDKVKTAIISAMEEKAKTEIAEQLAESLKSINEQIEAVKKAADNTAEIKALKEAAEKAASDYAALVKGFDLLQVRVKSTRIAPTKEKSFKDTVAEAMDQKGDDFAKLSRGEIKDVRVELKAVTDVSTVNVDGSSVWGANYRPGMILLPNQIGHIRNAIGTQNAGPGTDYYFMREVLGEGAPAPTSEKKDAAATTVGTGLKPRFSVKWKEESVKFETIAGIMPISRKALNNIPGITSFLSSRVPELLLDAEDAQILYGTGTSPELKGILVSGNFVASTSGAAVLAEAIIDDIILLEDTHKRTAASIWMRPNAYQSFFKNKATGSGEYDLPMNVTFVGGVLYISGIPVFKTTALANGDYVVAANLGAELQIQENITMRFFEQNRDNVETNQLTLRVEETVALPVFGDNFFIKGAVPA